MTRGYPGDSPLSQAKIGAAIRPIVVTIPGEMRGKGRPRFSRRGGFVKVHTDEKTASAETWIKACAIDQVGMLLLSGPLRVQISVGVGVADSWSKKRKERALMQLDHPTGKPDFDNVAKLICDALNGILWKDDSQIVACSFLKYYSARPAAELCVWDL
jgi:Holliday junction resolvase RusA-like endonuclease